MFGDEGLDSFLFGFVELLFCDGLREGLGLGSQTRIAAGRISGLGHWPRLAGHQKQPEMIQLPGALASNHGRIAHDRCQLHRPLPNLVHQPDCKPCSWEE